jgi:hypothetical protein
VLPACVGLRLVRASLAPLRGIESTAAAIAGGDLSRRADAALHRPRQPAFHLRHPQAGTFEVTATESQGQLP